MNTYVEAHREASRYKQAGMSPAQLENRANDYDDAGKYGVAKAFRDVAAER